VGNEVGKLAREVKYHEKRRRRRMDYTRRGAKIRGE